MDWFKKHADAVAVIAVLCGGLLWMNGKFNVIEKDLAVMKAVMVMRNIMPSELACQNMEKK